MVAISLYRGNLHRVPPDVARRWLMPTPGISLKDFRHLLFRRSKALSLLPSSSTVFPSPTPTTTTTTVVANPNPNVNTINSPPRNQRDFNGTENPNSRPQPSNNVVTVEIRMEDAGDSAPLDQLPLLDDEDNKAREENKQKEIETAAILENPIPPALEVNDKVDTKDEKEKRKREVEEKLHILNEKKHNLVQALKQILNAEEELKRRSSMQASRPPLPLQADASNDSGSMTRHATPRTGSEANHTVDLEGGEGDDALNNNIQSRQLLRMSSTSPSAESALRKPPYFQHNVTWCLVEDGELMTKGLKSDNTVWGRDCIMWSWYLIRLEQHRWLLVVPRVLLPRETRVIHRTCQPCLYLGPTILRLHLPQLPLGALQVSEKLDIQVHGTKPMFSIIST